MTLKKEYRDLEMNALSQLRDKINKSDKISNFAQTKAIKVDLFDYCELVILNDRLVFIGTDGLQYSVFADVSLEDLIDILNK